MSLLKRLLYIFGLTNKKIKFLIVGLDNSGKTSIVSRLQIPKEFDMKTSPTVGFSVEAFTKGRIDFTVFDMSGESKYRSIWEKYYIDTHAVVFVIDRTDEVRLVVAKNEILSLLNNQLLSKDCPLLIYLNKNDISQGLTQNEIIEILNIPQHCLQRQYRYQSCSALNNQGIEEGIDWLSQVLVSR